MFTTIAVQRLEVADLRQAESVFGKEVREIPRADVRDLARLVRSEKAKRQADPFRQ